MFSLSGHLIQRKYIITVLALCALVVLTWTAVGSEADTPSAQIAGRYPGQATLSGRLQFDAVLDPPVAEVGDQVTLTLALRNNTDNPVAPRLDIVLPDGIRLDVNRLRAGTSVNFPSGEVNWQPVINGRGGTAQATLSFTVVRIQPEKPEQTIQFSLDENGRVRQTSVVLWMGARPTADLTVSPLRASVGQPVQLAAIPGGSGPFRQTWRLGDGRIVPATDPAIVYPAVGTYEIELNLSNPLDTATASESVVIVPEPAAFFKVGDTTLTTNQEVQFTSQSGGQPPLEYVWEFGDGTFSTEPNPTHRYPAPGSYTAVLTVRNAYGQARNHLTIQVGEAPIADAVLPAAANAGQSITGQAFTDESVHTIEWTMGDGRTYRGELISHTYNSGGDYVVTMNAVNDYGNTAVTKLLRVTGGASYVYLPVAVSVDGRALVVQEDVTEAEAQLVVNTIEFVENESDIVLEPNPEIVDQSAADQLFWYINDARRQAGLTAVNRHTVLSTAAKVHTDDMAAEGFTSHTGSDGTRPYERLARVGYRDGGYAGETTAWGFRHPYEAVQFWLESPPHRAILLNPIADHVGVAQTRNYNAPSVWYWTAEFASTYGSITSQMREAGIRVIKPSSGRVYTFTQTAIFGWSWPLPLAEGEQFAVYFRQDGEEQLLGRVSESINEEQVFDYGLPVSTLQMAPTAGDYGWLVRLEDAAGNSVTRSQVRPITLAGLYPTPQPTPQPTVPVILPTVAPPTTATPLPPTSTPVPPSTATPLPPTPTPDGPGIIDDDDATSTPTPSPTATLPAPTATQEPAVTPSPTVSPTPSVTPTPLIPVIDDPTPSPTPQS